LPELTIRSGKYPASDAVGVGQNEQPLPNVRRARFSRCEHARCDRVTHAAKLGIDSGEAQAEVSLDIFEEDEPRLDLSDDAGDLGPEVSGILFTSPVPCLAEGLTGIAGRDEMNAAAPRATVE
jgi:hypothetical protein